MAFISRSLRPIHPLNQVLRRAATEEASLVLRRRSSLLVLCCDEEHAGEGREGGRAHRRCDTARLLMPPIGMRCPDGYSPLIDASGVARFWGSASALPQSRPRSDWRRSLGTSAVSEPRSRARGHGNSTGFESSHQSTDRRRKTPICLRLWGRGIRPCGSPLDVSPLRRERHSVAGSGGNRVGSRRSVQRSSAHSGERRVCAWA